MRSSVLVTVLALALAASAPGLSKSLLRSAFPVHLVHSPFSCLFSLLFPGAQAATCDLDSFDWAAYSASISGCVTAYQSSFSSCGSTISCYCTGFSTYSTCVLGSSDFCVAESLREALKTAQDALAQYCTFANSLFTYTFTFRISSVVGECNGRLRVRCSSPTSNETYILKKQIFRQSLRLKRRRFVS